MINDKILEFRTLFAGKDIQDYIAMVVIWFATEQIAQQAAGIENEELEIRMGRIESMLDEMLIEAGSV